MPSPIFSCLPYSLTHFCSARLVQACSAHTLSEECRQAQVARRLSAFYGLARTTPRSVHAARLERVFTGPARHAMTGVTLPLAEAVPRVAVD